MIRPSLYISLLSIALSFSGGFQQGYITSALNPPYVYIESFINETFTERFGAVMSDDVLNAVWSFLNVLFPIASIVGQMLAVWLCKRFGRKGTAIISCLLFLPGTILSSLSYPCRSFEMIFIGRFLWSLGFGMNQVNCTVWIIECAPKSIRGAMGAMQELSTAIGALLCNTVAIPLSTDTLWPWIFATDVPIVLVAIMLFVFLPDSPVSILERTENIDQARAILAKYHGVSISAPEINQHLNMERKHTDGKWSEAIPGIFWIFNPCGPKDNRLKIIQQAVWIGVSVKMAYVFSGAQTLRAYTSFFFHDMDHYSLNGANMGSWIISGLRIVFSLLPVLFVDRFGRRLLMNSSMVITVVGLIAVVVGLLFGDSLQILSAIAFAAVILASAGGVGSMSRFYAGELVPRSILLSSTSILAIIEDTTRIIVEFVWFPLANDVGAYSMLIFLAPSAILLIIIWTVCPETSNRTVTQILDGIALRKKLIVTFNE